MQLPMGVQIKEEMKMSEFFHMRDVVQAGTDTPKQPNRVEPTVGDLDVDLPEVDRIYTDPELGDIDNPEIGNV